MKIKSLFVAVLLLGGVLVAPNASAAEFPKIESFTFTPDEIELNTSNTKISFEIVVSHPSGIADSSTRLTLQNPKNMLYATDLVRIDTPVNYALQKVTFRGSITLPRTTLPGAYSFFADPIKNSDRAGYQFSTGTINPSPSRKLVGAESGVLVRKGGELGLDYATFVGPTFDTTVEKSYLNSAKYGSNPDPIWKVGEIFDPSVFYELRVPALQLLTSTSSPEVCVSTGTTIKLIATGSCVFKVYSQKTPDYLAKVDERAVYVSAARAKVTLNVEKIANQSSKILPKSLELPKVYGPTAGWVLPQSVTPNVCYTSLFIVTWVTAGTCSLTYNVEGTPTLAPSDTYVQTFEILNDGQPIVAPTPTSTPTVKPVVKRTISCVKGTKTVKKTAVSPKCPKGFRVKR